MSFSHVCLNISKVKTYIARCYLDRYVLGLTIKYSLSLSILSEGDLCHYRTFLPLLVYFTFHYVFYVVWDNYMGFGFNKRPVMIMEMHVNISGPTKVDVGGNDSWGITNYRNSSTIIFQGCQEGPNRIGEDHGSIWMQYLLFE